MVGFYRSMGITGFGAGKSIPWIMNGITRMKDSNLDTLKMRMLLSSPTHRHLPDGENDAYQYVYLFKYALDLPPGANSIVLPQDDRIRIFRHDTCNK